DTGVAGLAEDQVGLRHRDVGLDDEVRDTVAVDVARQEEGARQGVGLGRRLGRFRDHPMIAAAAAHGQDDRSDQQHHRDDHAALGSEGGAGHPPRQFRPRRQVDDQRRG
ncbi:hypothetical protein LTR94_036048, partial [Friedmanniomyces endolithicus]